MPTTTGSAGVRACGKTCATPARYGTPPGVARLMRRAGLQGVPQRRQWRKKPSRASPKCNPQSSGTELSCHGPQYEMGHGYHLHSDRRALVITVCRAGLVFVPRGGLVDESTAGSSIDCPSRADGLVAATGTDPRHSALGSGLSIYLRGIPIVSGKPPGRLQHECRG